MAGSSEQALLVHLLGKQQADCRRQYHLQRSCAGSSAVPWQLEAAHSSAWQPGGQPLLSS
jgi:hypothetical protein